MAIGTCSTPSAAKRGLYSSAGASATTRQPFARKASIRPRLKLMTFQEALIEMTTVRLMKNDAEHCPVGLGKRFRGECRPACSGLARPRFCGKARPTTGNISILPPDWGLRAMVAVGELASGTGAHRKGKAGMDPGHRTR